VPATVEFRDVAFAPVLDDLRLHIGAGESVAFIGRSGAGKTTALRLINGLVTPTRGDVVIDGVPLSATDLIALRRRSGYIIQGSGLFPHRTVYENVSTIPRLLGWSDAQTRDAAAPLLARLALPLERFGRLYPARLSGGEQQRVGIARALIASPSLLLCDEPFSALDPIVRRELQDAFRALRDDRGATIVFVTHDIAEALRVTERVVVFDNGRIVADLAARDVRTSDVAIVRQLVESAVLPS
jgi:osmoprotectant transport system ATP-binding protein